MTCARSFVDIPELEQHQGPCQIQHSAVRIFQDLDRQMPDATMTHLRQLVQQRINKTYGPNEVKIHIPRAFTTPYRRRKKAGTQ